MGKTMGKGVGFARGLARLNFPKKMQGGFTLIELLVVISIIGLLSSVVLSSLNSARAKAEDSKHIQSLSQLKRAMELYYDNNNGVYPPLPVASASWHANCWDCTGGIVPVDAGRIVALSQYLSQRPTGKSGAVFIGYFYKVSADGKDYKISLMGTINNTSNIPAYMTDSSFYAGSTVASVYSSNAAKNWSWAANP